MHIKERLQEGGQRTRLFDMEMRMGQLLHDHSGTARRMSSSTLNPDPYCSSVVSPFC